MDSYMSSEIYIPELHTPTKRTEFGSIIRKLWTKIALTKLGVSYSTSKMPFLLVDKPNDDLQEVYESKSENATNSFEIEIDKQSEPLLENESSIKSHKYLRATTAVHSLPDINDSELFFPSTSLEDLIQTHSLIDSDVPCSSRHISSNSPEILDDDEIKIEQFKSKVQILRLAHRSEDHSAVLWRAEATRDFPQTFMNDDLHHLKTKLHEVFGRDVETPSAGPEAGKVITSKAYVPMLSGFQDFSCNAYYTATELAETETHQDKAIQVDLTDGVRRRTEGLRVTPFEWLYLQNTGNVSLVDYRVSI